MVSATPALAGRTPAVAPASVSGVSTAAATTESVQVASSKDAPSAPPAVSSAVSSRKARESAASGSLRSEGRSPGVQKADSRDSELEQTQAHADGCGFTATRDCGDGIQPFQGPASRAEEEQRCLGTSEEQVPPRVKAEVGASSASQLACMQSGETAGEAGESRGESLDVASLFLSPTEDLNSWASDGADLLLPPSSFVSAEAISQHRGPMSLGSVALFIFSLFLGDVRMGILSAQGRLLAWRCLLYLAEQHDRQGTGPQPQQPQHGGPAVTASSGDPGIRRRSRLQRESVATSKGRRSVRHAFLLDRSGGHRVAAGGLAGSGSTFSPGANDEWGETEEETVAAACAAHLREDQPREVAGEQALATPSMSLAISVQSQLQQGAQTLGFEAYFPRFIGGSIDRRWALQQRHLRIPAEVAKGETAPKEETLDMRLEEFGAATAPKMWPRVEALPERIFVGLPIQVACWVSWGRTDGGEAGRMLWRDCEVAQLLPGGAFKARLFSSAGETRQLICYLRDFVPPRVPIPSPHECAWRLVPLEADPSRDIYPGTCLSVGLSGSSPSQQDQQQPEVARAYFVDVMVQDIYFTLEQTTRARQALAEARERDEGTGGRIASSSRRTPGCTDTGGPVEGLRPNCQVRAMRVMVLRSGGAANEFALVSGRTIYKLGYDLYLHAGFGKEPAASRPRQGGSCHVWAIPRALSPAGPEQMKGAAVPAGLTGGTVEANAKRWQYRTQEDSREWVTFPPFLVAYMPYDCAARYTETHPLLLRYLQPELDLSALSRGIWRLVTPQYKHPSVPPVLVPHPSDLPTVEDKPVHATVEAGSPEEGVVLLESPYTRTNGGAAAVSEARSASLASEEVADSLYAAQVCEPPHPVGSTQSGSDSGGRARVLGINYLANLLCSAGDGMPPKELISKALPFFRGLLPHLGSQNADSWQLEVARAAVRAADQAKEMHVDEQETGAEKLRRQGISFGGSLGGSGVAAEGGRSQRGTERRAEAVEAEGGDAWEWLGTSGSRYPTSSDISRFLLRTSGLGIGGSQMKGRGMEASAPPTEGSVMPGGAGRRRPLEVVAGLLSGASRRNSGSELGGPEPRSKAEDSSFLQRGAGVGGVEGDFHGGRRLAATATSSRALPEEGLSGSNRTRGGLSATAFAAGGSFGTSTAMARRRPLVRREEEEDFQPPARATTGSRQASAGGRAGVARRAARNVSYTALAGMEPGPEDPAFYRPMKRVARGELHTTSGADPAATSDFWDHPHAKDAAGDTGAGEHHSSFNLQQWAALQRQAAAAAEERLLSSQGTQDLVDRGTDGTLSTDQLHEALKGFVQSFKAGTSPPAVSVPPMARNRSFAASH